MIALIGVNRPFGFAQDRQYGQEERREKLGLIGFVLHKIVHSSLFIVNCIN